jgi:hypothetical protein
MVIITIVRIEKNVSNFRKKIADVSYIKRGCG